MINYFELTLLYLNDNIYYLPFCSYGRLVKLSVVHHIYLLRWFTNNLVYITISIYGVICILYTILNDFGSNEVQIIALHRLDSNHHNNKSTRSASNLSFPIPSCTYYTNIMCTAVAANTETRTASETIKNIFNTPWDYNIQ